MIIVRISGGIGNQMFQYAMARAIKEKTGFEVRLDDSFYAYQKPEDAKREYLLDKFHISLEKATKEDMESLGFDKMWKQGLFAKLWRKWTAIKDASRPIPKKKIVKEESFLFDEKIFTLKDNTYVSGVWQNYKYWHDIKEKIRKELSLKEPASDKAHYIEEIILKEKEGVSIHVRRGDYVNGPKGEIVSNICTPEYYEKAIDSMKSKLAKPKFFVFSDDIEWVKKNIPIENAFYVSQNGLTVPEEIILMSKCANHITANSSFSWWGAWLGENKEKIVTCPALWFKDRNTTEIAPQNWIKIEAR